VARVPVGEARTHHRVPAGAEVVVNRAEVEKQEESRAVDGVAVATPEVEVVMVEVAQQAGVGASPLAVPAEEEAAQTVGGGRVPVARGRAAAVGLVLGLVVGSVASAVEEAVEATVGTVGVEECLVAVMAVVVVVAMAEEMEAISVEMVAEGSSEVVEAYGVG